MSLDETTESLRERASAVIARDTESNVPRPKSVTYIDYENPFSMVNEASSGTPYVATLSKYAWVGCGGDVYVLDLMGKGHVRIQPQEMPEGILICCLYSYLRLSPLQANTSRHTSLPPHLTKLHALP